MKFTKIKITQGYNAKFKEVKSSCDTFTITLSQLMGEELQDSCVWEVTSKNEKYVLGEFSTLNEAKTFLKENNK